jgi:hypothetical protein
MPLNAPNLLTLLRLLLIPLFIAAYYSPFTYAHAITTALFVAAAATDWLDGYLARRLKQSSYFGAFLDPVADKLMVAAALVLLLADPRVQAEVRNRRLGAARVDGRNRKAFARGGFLRGQAQDRAPDGRDRFFALA